VAFTVGSMAQQLLIGEKWRTEDYAFQEERVKWG
jgi:hypothetical protein